MLPSSLVTPAFFEALSYLFYAVSVADDILVLDEKRAIHKEIKTYWVYNVDGYSSSELMYACMRQLIDEVINEEEAFDVFKRFYLDNQEHFTLDLKKAIYESTNTVAASFSGKNKSEMHILAQLMLLFSNK